MENLSFEESIYMELSSLMGLGKDSLPMWAKEKVKAPDSVRNKSFYRFLPERYISDVKIPVSKIVGSDHVSYNKGTWIEMLGNLKNRTDFRQFQDREALESFILDEKIAEKKTVLKYGEEYFISRGNHRICYAKFLGIEYLSCKVIEYVFDEEVFIFFSKLIDIGIKPHIHNQSHSREDWYFHLNKLLIRLNIHDIDDFIKDFKSIKFSKYQEFLYRLFNLKKEHPNPIVYKHPDSKKTIRLNKYH